MSMGEDHWLLRLLGEESSWHTHKRHRAAVAYRDVLLFTRSFESVVNTLI